MTRSRSVFDGAITSNTFSDERRFRPDMVALLGKIAVEQDASIAKDTRHMHVMIDVTHNDGTVVSRICRKPPGTWGETIPAELHRAKIRDCLSARLADFCRRR